MLADNLAKTTHFPSFWPNFYHDWSESSLRFYLQQLRTVMQ